MLEAWAKAFFGKLNYITSGFVSAMLNPRIPETVGITTEHMASETRGVKEKQEGKYGYDYMPIMVCCDVVCKCV